MAIATSEDIRVKYENVAKYLITVGNTRAFKTGALRNSIKVLKTFEDTKKVVFDLTSLRYGVFLNFGFTHWRSGKFIIRPFATEAANSKPLKQMIDDYNKSKQQDVALKQLEIIKGKLGKFGMPSKISPNSSTKRYSYP